MTLPIRAFLAAVLDGSASDIESHKKQRWSRLERASIPCQLDFDSMSTGQVAAMSWLCEMLSLDMIHRRFPERCAWLRFEELLEKPEETLTRLAEFLGYSVPHPDWKDHPLWTQYAKRPGVFYDNHLRNRLLDNSYQRFEQEIHAGLAWIQAVQEPRVASLINRG
jgi:hypothetical protein